MTVDYAAWDRMTRRWTVYDAPAMPLKKADFGPYNMRCRTIQYAVTDHVLCPQTPLAARQKHTQTTKNDGLSKKRRFIYIDKVHRKAGRARERARLTSHRRQIDLGARARAGELTGASDFEA